METIKAPLKHPTIQYLFIFWGLLMLGSVLGCGSPPSKAEALRDQNDLKPETHGEESPIPDDAASSPDAPSTSAHRAPSGLLRAQAWPKEGENSRWQALEDGRGVYVDTGAMGARTFVLSSVTDSLPTAGVRIHFPETLAEENLPTMVTVAVSPTPIRVTRDGWPSIAGLLRHVGFAELSVQPGETIYLEFEKIERVSLLQLQFWTRSSRAPMGMGQVRLVHQRATDALHAVRTIPLSPVEDANTLPEDANILGTDGRITLPHSPRSR